MAEASPMELTIEELEALEPSFYGPTWQRAVDGGWLLPDLTLGWQIAGWCSTYLRADDGSQWRFTKEQLRFVLWWYAVDESGRFVYRTGVLQRMKGWGKDPLLAVLCLVEFVGPSRVLRDEFGEACWADEDDVAAGRAARVGDPLGTPAKNAWVQVTAVNQSQTTNTFALFPSLMSDRLIAEFDIKPGAELIRALRGRNRLEAVTSSYRAIEGKRTTFTLLNETHHWVAGNNGHKMYETIDGNSTKMDSRYLAITNAYLPGEDSVAERMRMAWQEIRDGLAVDVGFLYDSVEAHPKTPLTPEALRVVLPKIRGDAKWLNVETIIQSVLNKTIAASRSRRMYLNQIVAEEDALYQEDDWDDLLDEEALLSPGDDIVLGFDGGKTDDGTALVALRLSDMAAFVLGYWQRPDNWPTGKDAPRWEVPRERVDSAVHEAFRVYNVLGMYADVALWESYIDDWAEQYGEGLGIKASERHAIGWDMRQSLQRVTRAHERLVQAIYDGKLKHSGDRLMRRHVLNVFRNENKYGVSFMKESRESPRKVDIYAALVLAFECLHDYRNRGKKPQKRTGRSYWF